MKGKPISELHKTKVIPRPAQVLPHFSATKTRSKIANRKLTIIRPLILLLNRSRLIIYPRLSIKITAKLSPNGIGTTKLCRQSKQATSLGPPATRDSNIIMIRPNFRVICFASMTTQTISNNTPKNSSNWCATSWLRRRITPLMVAASWVNFRIKLVANQALRSKALFKIIWRVNSTRWRRKLGRISTWSCEIFLWRRDRKVSLGSKQYSSRLFRTSKNAS